MITSSVRLNKDEKQMLVSASSGTRNGERFSKLTIAEQQAAVANIDSVTNYLKVANPQAFLQTESDLENRVFCDVPVSKLPYKYSLRAEPRKPR